MIPLRHRQVKADEAVAVRRGSYHGGLLLSSSGGAATVAVYDGPDTSGELIDYFTVQASEREIHFYERGIAIRDRIYIDVSSNITSFVFFYLEPNEE